MGKKTVVTSLGGFDTCYTVPIGKQVPTMTFMFEGADLSMKQENFLIYSSTGTTTCLAMSASPSLNVIANMQQQNHRILFDLPNSRIGISAESCSWKLNHVILVIVSGFCSCFVLVRIAVTWGFMFKFSLSCTRMTYPFQDYYIFIYGI